MAKISTHLTTLLKDGKLEGKMELDLKGAVGELINCSVLKGGKRRRIVHELSLP